MFTAAFWKDVTERAVKTVAQALIALWLVGGVFNVLEADWQDALGVALGAGVISVLTSVASAGVNKAEDEEPVTPSLLANATYKKV